MDVKHLALNLFNRGSHVGLGSWTGAGINNPEYRHGAWAFLLTFSLYQGIGVFVKKDKGYPEIKEFMIGMGGWLAWRRLKAWRKNHVK